MGMPGATELMIVLAIVLILFGGGKLAGVGKSMGTAISEFKSALRGDEEKEEDPVNHQSTATGSKPE
jgi:sec-independent protein translocase protein TatA